MHGHAQEPRLNVFRSINHIYAQIVDDSQGQTLVSASTRDKEIRTTLKTGGNIAAAKVVGKTLANRASASRNLARSVRSWGIRLPRADKGSGRCGTRSGT